MPVIVVGADTRIGGRLVEALLDPDREVRAFVTDPEAAAAFKSAGAKVATGDVSDSSHVAAAATRCFSAVLITSAAEDDRPRAFASSRGDVLEGWATAMTEAGVARVIWVGPGTHPDAGVREQATVIPDADEDETVRRVVAMDDAAVLDGEA